MKMKVEERQKAREMRKNGESLKTIARQLEVAKSTVSGWIKDIELSEDQKRNLLDRSRMWGYNSGQKRKHEELRKQYQEIGREKIRQGNYSSLYLTGCMLYWAEGYKSNNKNKVTFVNSDPSMIQLFLRFLRENFDIEDNIRLSINCYTDNDLSIEEIENYWLDISGLTRDRLKKTQVNKSSSYSKTLRKNILKYGTVGINVNRTDVLQEIYGAIQEYAGFTREDWLG